VFEQIKAQEQTKQAELKAKEAEFRVQAEQAAIVSALAMALLLWQCQHWVALALEELCRQAACQYCQPQTHMLPLLAGTAPGGSPPITPPPPAALQAHERVKWEEQRKAMQQDAQQKAQLAQYQDELARKRAESEHEKQRVRNVELVQLQVRGGVQWISLGCWVLRVRGSSAVLSWCSCRCTGGGHVLGGSGV
jgi:hypothetical protein